MAPSPVDPRNEPNLPECLFCRRISVGKFVAESSLAVVFRDAYPITPGHLHIVPRHHVENFFDLSPFERDSLWDMIFEVKNWIEEEYSPDGYNIGINIGKAAGETVPHTNIHVIPRYKKGADGGIRWVLGGENVKYERRGRRSATFLPEIARGEAIVENALAVGLEDAYPVVPGHCHAAPRRPVASFFDLEPEERDALWDIVGQMYKYLEKQYSPEGYNLGINVGDAAGQNLEHTSIHLIPRKFGDSEQSAGIRWVLGGQGADYELGRT